MTCGRVPNGLTADEAREREQDDDAVREDDSIEVRRRIMVAAPHRPGCASARPRDRHRLTPQRALFFALFLGAPSCCTSCSWSGRCAGDLLLLTNWHDGRHPELSVWTATSDCSTTASSIGPGQQPHPADRAPTVVITLAFVWQYWSPSAATVADRSAAAPTTGWSASSHVVPAVVGILFFIYSPSGCSTRMLGLVG